MKTFVISLKTAYSRRRTMQRQFDYLGLEFEFFDAVSADANPERYFEGLDLDTFRLNTYRAPLPSEIACYASHRALWNYAATRNEPITVLEDDARLSDRFGSSMEAIRNLIKRYGFIRLQAYKRERAIEIGANTYDLLQTDGYRLRYLSRVPVCLLGYAISPAAGNNLVRASAIFDSPVDKFVQRTWEHQTPVFGIEPAAVGLSEHAFRSTIGSRAEKKKDAQTLCRRSAYKLVGEIRRRQFDRQQLRRLAKPGSVSAFPNAALARELRANPPQI